MRREFKGTILTYVIIMCYQLSFGITWQLMQMKNLQFFTCETFLSNGAIGNFDIFNHNLLPTIMWHHLAADVHEKLSIFHLQNLYF